MINEVVYAVGYQGMVYRFEDNRRWIRFDRGLPSTIDLQAIGGGEEELCAVGRHGAIWIRDRDRWSECASPTNWHLTCITSTPSGEIYVAGHRGTLIRGKGAVWEVVDHDSTKSDLWSLQWFDGHLYAATIDDVLVLDDDALVSLSPNTLSSSYRLDVFRDKLWSFGQFDVAFWNGDEWSTICKADA